MSRIIDVATLKVKHYFLESKQHFADWIKNRINEYGFTQDVDFLGVHTVMSTEAGFFGRREKTVTDYHLFSKWIQRRIEEYGFTQALDFIGVDKIVRTEAGFFGQRDKTVQGYYLSLDMAKELCMVERNDPYPDKIKEKVV